MTTSPRHSPAQIYRNYNDAQNDRAMDKVEALLAPDLSVRVNGRPSLASAEEDRRALQTIYSAYPDYRRELLELLELPGTVVARWVMRGTPARPGDPELAVAGCSIARVDSTGKIADAELYYDSTALDRVMIRPADG